MGFSERSDNAVYKEIHFAFITGPDGVGMTNLGTFGGYESTAFDINNLGEVIGIATTADDNAHSFFYSHGDMTNLSMLDAVVSNGWTEITISDINNNGQIVGTGVNSHGQGEVFILSYTPDTQFNPSPIFIPLLLVPEPETYAMLLAGLGLIGFMARRRKEIVK